MYKIFIDGQAGTTGLQIHERLRLRRDIELLAISDTDRKNPIAKQELLRQADIAILCLPDDAAKAMVELAKGTGTRILDASTAFRTHPDWAYGLPELHSDQRSVISKASYVSNPGCYPSGFLLAVTPLIKAGLLQSRVQLSISAVSGYSGGGRQLIEKYENQQAPGSKTPSAKNWAVRPYSLSFDHKHLPEMQHYASLTHAPLFMPSVGNYHQGMLVSTPLAKEYLSRQLSLDEIYQCLQTHYNDDKCIYVHKPNSDQCLTDGFLDPQANNHTNRNDIYIFGNSDQIMLISQLDNLGKGASGAAVQNLNLMLGVDELTGLSLERSKQ